MKPGKLRRLIFAIAVLIGLALLVMVGVIIFDPIGRLELKLSANSIFRVDTVETACELPESAKPEDIVKDYFAGYAAQNPPITSGRYQILEMRKIQVIKPNLTGFDPYFAALVDTDRGKLILVFHYNIQDIECWLVSEHHP